MLFTEPAFLFVFLPVLLGVYFASPGSLRNTILTVGSLAFYALGEWKFLPLMLLSIGLNYGLALWIEQTRGSRWGRAVLTLGIASDLVLLLVFKYTNWIVENLDHVFGTLGLGSISIPAIALPLGISFFTFHKISYKIDVYRGETSAQRNPLTLALYILFFPQLVAGPIVRYHDIADQLERRTVGEQQFAYGIRRIMIGFAKKVIIANSVAVVADAIFAAPANELGVATAWLGILAYTLQIYFDFSGYSDMAIGLAHLFGFRFLENFDHPYSSRSITEFWRRWHISLSRWFRDYLYIPLGGNRGSELHTYRNLLIVFFLCGLWHGASSEFVVWGLFHGTFLVIERLGWGAVIARQPRLFGHVYMLLVVMVGWVFFRAGSFGTALEYLGSMLGLGSAAGNYPVALYINPWVITTMVAGVIASFPVGAWLTARLSATSTDGTRRLPTPLQVATICGLFGLFSLTIVLIAAGTYNPFLYFRF